MKKLSSLRLVAGLVGTCAIGGCSYFYYPTGSSRIEYGTVGPRPAPRAEVMPASPGPDYVWVAGHWGRAGNDDVWVSGSWVLPKPGYVMYEPTRPATQRPGLLWIDGQRWPDRDWIDRFWLETSWW